MKVGISLGSNIGDRENAIHSAIAELRNLHEGADETFLEASIIETEPVDCDPGTPSFLNTVVELESTLSPMELLMHCQSIEQAAGRPAKRKKNAPRAIDVDLLYIGDLKIETDELTLPHPRMHERAFVMEPLREIGRG